MWGGTVPLCRPSFFKGLLWKSHTEKNITPTRRPSSFPFLPGQSANFQRGNTNYLKTSKVYTMCGFTTRAEMTIVLNKTKKKKKVISFQVTVSTVPSPVEEGWLGKHPVHVSRWRCFPPGGSSGNTLTHPQTRLAALRSVIEATLYSIPAF